MEDDFTPDWNFKDPVAEAISEGGDYKRAERLANCAKFAKRFRCPRDGHEENHTIFCELPTCVRCAKRLARERRARYSATFESIDAKHVTFLEIQVKYNELKQAQKMAAKVLSDYVSNPAAIVHFAAGVTKYGGWRWRVLVMHDDPITNQKWGARMTFLETHSKAGLPRMLSLFFKPCIPDEPEQAAKMGLTFKDHFRRLRYSKLNVEKRKQLTDKSTKSAKKCPVCGGKLVYVDLVRRSEVPVHCHFETSSPPTQWFEADLSRLQSSWAS